MFPFQKKKIKISNNLSFIIYCEIIVNATLLILLKVTTFICNYYVMLDIIMDSAKKTTFNNFNKLRKIRFLFFGLMKLMDGFKRF